MELEEDGSEEDDRKGKEEESMELGQIKMTEQREKKERGQGKECERGGHGRKERR